MQYDNIYETKENKKDNNWKIQNLITSTQTRVPNNTKIHQSKVKMQEKCKKKSTKNGKKKLEKEREINNLLCVENERKRERDHFVCEKISKYIVREGIRKAKK